MIKTDVLIIGGGLAGFSAALSAVHGGAEVLLCEGNGGASIMHSGVFDTDFDPARINDISVPDMTSMGRNLELLSVTSPGHPYSVMGGRNAEPMLRESMENFRGCLDGAGLEISGDPHDRMLLISSMGTVRRVRFALGTIATGMVRDPAEMRIVFVGIAGMPLFNARYAAASAESAIKRATGVKAGAISHVTVELPGCDDFNNITHMQIAEGLDDSERAAGFANNVAEAISGGQFTHAFFPAVLGFREFGKVIQMLEEKLGVSVAELASVPPSVPGARMAEAAGASLSGMGVKIIRGKTVGYYSTNGVLNSIDIETKHDGVVAVETSAVVLATGRFIGGGLRHDEFLRETIFDLPVFIDGRPVKEEDAPMKFLAAKIGARQPLFEAGVKVNNALRPCGAGGELLYENLFCAGSIIGGYDAQRGGCGSGVALVTGMKAGAYAAEMNVVKN